MKNDPLLTKAWIRKGMAEQELKRYQTAYGDYQVALNQSKQSDNYYKFLIKKIKQCFDQILLQHNNQQNGANLQQHQLQQQQQSQQQQQPQISMSHGGSPHSQQYYNDNNQSMQPK